MSEIALGPDGLIGAERVGFGIHGRYGQGRPRVDDARVCELRDAGLSQEDIAREMGIARGTVNNVLRRSGKQGGRALRKGGQRDRDVTLERALEEFGGLYIELADLPGGRDGYIATIQDCYPGLACTTIAAAIRSARAAMPKEAAS